LQVPAANLVGIHLLLSRVGKQGRGDDANVGSIALAALQVPSAKLASPPRRFSELRRSDVARGSRAQSRQPRRFRHPPGQTQWSATRFHCNSAGARNPRGKTTIMPPCEPGSIPAKS